VVTEPNGDVSIGEVADGFGTKVWMSGRKQGGCYTGHFQGGEYHGHGRRVWPAEDGRVLEGSFTAGESFGESTYTLYNGTKYTGNFAKGERHGLGTIEFAGGARFVGRFEKDGLGGQGKLLGVGGSVLAEGDWSSPPFKFSKLTPSGGAIIGATVSTNRGKMSVNIGPNGCLV
jgi:hypothetical protein